MSVRGVLLDVLKNLDGKEIDTLNFFLSDNETTKPSVPKSQLEGATRPGIAAIIIQTYNQRATEVMRKILKKIPRNDLVEKLTKISRSEEEDQQHQQPTSSSSSTDASDQPRKRTATERIQCQTSKQRKRSPSVEVSAADETSTGALNTNTLSKYNHITCKELIQSGPPAVYRLIPKNQTIGKDIRKMSLGKRDPIKTNRTILLVGETGAGKSTLITTLVNYAMGVKWEDNIWFEIIEKEKKSRKSEEQKPDVVVYEIFEGKALPYSLTIIDTPGYMETEHDEIISRRLLDLFNLENRVREIDVVGLVQKASENRLSYRLRYIVDSVISLFGKDLQENIVALITYSSGGEAINILEALKAANIKCAENEMNRPVHFLFDKCPNLERTKDIKVKWDIMKEGMTEFTDYLIDSKPKLLKSTAEVLNARIQLTACVQKLQKRIEDTELKQTEIQQSLKKAQQEMENNQKYTKEVEEDSPVKEAISGGTWGLKLFKEGAVCCQVCKETCHYPCTMAWSPERCNIMKGGHCTVCKGKCPVSEHVKEQWYFETKTQKVEKPNEDMKRKYEKGKADHECLQKDLKKTKEELQKDKVLLLEEAFQHVLKLEEIALNSDSLSTHVHLDFLMKNMKERGDTEKFKKLEEIKNRGDKGTRAELLNKLAAVRK